MRDYDFNAMTVLTDEELKDVYDTARAIIVSRRQVKELAVSATFMPGMTVSFIHRGQKFIGKVMKINSKTCKVHVTVPKDMMWKVSSTLLTKEA